MATVTLFVRNTGAGVPVNIKGIGTFPNKQVTETDRVDEDIVIIRPENADLTETEIADLTPPVEIVVEDDDTEDKDEKDPDPDEGVN